MTAYRLPSTLIEKRYLAFTSGHGYGLGPKALELCLGSLICANGADINTKVARAPATCGWARQVEAQA